MKISVIIPMYNESAIIADTARTLSEYMQRSFDSYEIIFFDDGSKDGSLGIVQSLDLPYVRALGYEQNRGKGSAVRHAMLKAQGEVRIFTDADLAYGTDVIAKAYGQMQAIGADMLIGSRNMDKDGYEGYTFSRRIASKVYKKFLCLVGGFRLSDSQCGFKAFTADTAQQIFSECEVDGFAFDFEVIMRATAKNKKIVEMPVKVLNHRDSTIHLLRDSCRMLGEVIRIKKSIKK